MDRWDGLKMKKTRFVFGRALAWGCMESWSYEIPWSLWVSSVESECWQDDFELSVSWRGSFFFYGYLRG
jgi:hypothetical protein